jgi:NADH-quinone oxidoreductase subunit J
MGVLAAISEVAIPELITFVLASIICLGGAIGVIGFQNPIHSALSLVATLFGVAVLFVAQQAHFLGAVQVIVYAGAVVVLFLFVIMLLGVDRRNQYQVDWESNSSIVAMVLVLIVGGLFLGLVGRQWSAPENARAQAACITPAQFAATMFEPAAGVPTPCPSEPGKVVNPRYNSPAETGLENVSAVSRDFLTAHLFAFQATAVLLIIAVIGTVVLAKRVPKSERAEDDDQDRREYAALLDRDLASELVADPLGEVTK